MQVKILVPNSTAGMIIGKGGNYIKQIKEESGSYVQISQKAKDQTLQERCITVIGKLYGSDLLSVMFVNFMSSEVHRQTKTARPEFALKSKLQTSHLDEKFA